LSGAPENAVAESEHTVVTTRREWEHQAVLRSMAEVVRSNREDCLSLLNKLISFADEENTDS